MTLQASKEITDVSSQNPTRMLTFLGKGGSGKTTSAVFAAQVCASPCFLFLWTSFRAWKLEISMIDFSHF